MNDDQWMVHATIFVDCNGKSVTVRVRHGRNPNHVDYGPVPVEWRDGKPKLEMKLDPARSWAIHAEFIHAFETLMSTFVAQSIVSDDPPRFVHASFDNHPFSAGIAINLAGKPLTLETIQDAFNRAING